jgi:hypothetical protein
MDSDSVIVACPYCGEAVELVVEPDAESSWVQDCEVCCSPWLVAVRRRGARVDVTVERAQ